MVGLPASLAPTAPANAAITTENRKPNIRYTLTPVLPNLDSEYVLAQALDPQVVDLDHPRLGDLDVVADFR